MSVHVLRAQGMIFSELTRRFGANPARFHEILHGTLYPGSWEAAVDRLTNEDPWNAEIRELISGNRRLDVLAALLAFDPAKRRFQQQLKRLRKTSPFVAQASGPRARRNLGTHGARSGLQR
jgi:hypothetical protein